MRFAISNRQAVHRGNGVDVVGPELQCLSVESEFEKANCLLVLTGSRGGRSKITLKNQGAAIVRAVSCRARLERAVKNRDRSRRIPRNLIANGELILGVEYVDIIRVKTAVIVLERLLEQWNRLAGQSGSPIVLARRNWLWIVLMCSGPSFAVISASMRS